jgi:hypothetical protein
MASTRNRNAPQNYCLEVREDKQALERQLYRNGANGLAVDTKLAGFGLVQGRMPWSTMSRNPVDVESALFGIGSTNLVTPQAPVTVEQKCLRYSNLPGLEESRRVIMPQPFADNRFARPFAIP